MKISKYSTVKDVPPRQAAADMRRIFDPRNVLGLRHLPAMDEHGHPIERRPDFRKQPTSSRS